MKHINKLYFVQIISILITTILILLKSINIINLEWKETFYPVLVTILAPFISILFGLFCMSIMFLIIYIFKNKEGKYKIRQSLKEINWRIDQSRRNKRNRK